MLKKTDNNQNVSLLIENEDSILLLITSNKIL